MNKIGLIIWREYITRVRKPSFLIMTILGPLLLIGGIFLVVILTLQESGDQEVLVIDESHLVTGRLKDTENIHYHYSPVMVEDSIFAKGVHTLKVYVPPNVTIDPKVEITFKKNPSANVQEQITSGIEKIVEGELLKINNIDEATYTKIRKRMAVRLYDIKDDSKESHAREKAGIGFAFGYMIFFFIFLYGIQVMRGVMEEKQNRIVEVLVSSVKPFQLMMGKIVGIAMVGLTQFLLWVLISGILVTVGVGFAKDKIASYAEQQGTAMMTTELKEQLAAGNGLSADDRENMETLTSSVEILQELPIAAILGLFVFYFLGGYLLYSSLYAAVGSAVDSEADSQQFMMPVTIPMMLGIFVAQTAVVNPDGPAVFWCSIIPFTSPIVMMIRIAIGNAFEHPWHLVLSMSLLVATFIFTTWLAGRIYRTGILMYGKKVTWKELGKWLFYKG
ncbi:MAG: ABC transporter permease [Flavobacteriales bacterium]|nr:ABC transporter permease [Flavobacteriales bacterium]